MSPLERRTPLERKKPLAAGKPLARGSGLTRKTPLPQGKPLDRGSALVGRAAPAPGPAERKPTPPRAPLARTASTTKRKAQANTGPTAAQRRLVYDRDGGRCARCGIAADVVGFNDHHRQNRGMGGRQGDARATANLPARRVILCGSGTTRCHGWVTEHPDEAERAGLIVRRGGGIDPAKVPVLTWRGWILLDDAGGWSSCAEPPDGDARSLATAD